nr:hypothetical protein [Tanacetum cinerariifolium]
MDELLTISPSAVLLSSCWRTSYFCLLVSLSECGHDLRSLPNRHCKETLYTTFTKLSKYFVSVMLQPLNGPDSTLISKTCNQKSQRLDKKKQEVKNIVEQATKRGTRIAKSLQNFRVKKSSVSLNNTSQISPIHAITPVLPIEEPEYFLSMGYEHLSTIPETESDEVIESSAKNLLPIPSEYEVTFDDESDDDESLFDEDVPMEDFKVYLNPLFDNEEINSDKLDPYCFNTESDFVEPLSNNYTLIDSSPKFDYLEEFSGALMPTSIVNEERIRKEHEEYISLMEKLLAINSVPRPLENFHANTIIEILPTSPILVKDSESQREEFDIFTGTDDLLPPGIESDDYDSEGDIHFLEELLVDDFIPFLENESSDFDH